MHVPSDSWNTLVLWHPTANQTQAVQGRETLNIRIESLIVAMVCLS
jgi:hypothetical protein